MEFIRTKLNQNSYHDKKFITINDNTVTAHPRLIFIKEEAHVITYRINSLDLVCGLAGPAGSESVQSSDSVGVPLALDQTGHLALQLWYRVSAGLPLICASLAALHVVASDAGATVIFWRLPGEEDATG